MGHQAGSAAAAAAVSRAAAAAGAAANAAAATAAAAGAAAFIRLRHDAPIVWQHPRVCLGRQVDRRMGGCHLATSPRLEHDNRGNHGQNYDSIQVPTEHIGKQAMHVCTYIRYTRTHKQAASGPALLGSHLAAPTLAPVGRRGLQNPNIPPPYNYRRCNVM